MKVTSIAVVVLAIVMSSAAVEEDKPTDVDELKISPVEHASLVVQHGSTTIYIDPVGDASQYAAFPKPDIILITHIHRDHLAPALIASVKTNDTVILGPKSVQDQMKDCTVITNGETVTISDISIQAIPAYNLTKERLQYHTKARGDHGYVLEMASKASWPLTANRLPSNSSTGTPQSRNSDRHHS